MEIHWLGHGCFRLKGKDATVLTDPAPPSTGYKISKVAADVVTISRDTPESSYRQAITTDAKFVTGPGEYEIAGVLFSGVRTDHGLPEGAQRNVAYVFDVDDVRICHLGSITDPPHADVVEAMTADILLIPVGGGAVLDAKGAAETVSLLEPKIVIPMLYKTDAANGDFEGVDKFLREMNAQAKPAENRLQVTKSNLPQDTTIVLLNYRS
jgi:L-ascorbate metabolism protein UlaG (beta-lactamase superfamily)